MNTKYTVILKSGRTFPMVNPAGLTQAEAERVAAGIFIDQVREVIPK